MRSLAVIAAVFFAASAHAQTTAPLPEKAPDAHSPNYHELALNIPDTGKLEYRVDRVTEKTGGAGAGKMALTYTYIDAYSADADGVYSFTPRLTQSTLLNFNGVAPAADVDTSSTTATLLMMDGVSFTTDEALQPDRITGFETLKTNYGKGIRRIILFQHPDLAGTAQEQDMIQRDINTIFSRLDAQSAAGIFLPEQALLSWPHNAGLELGQTRTVQTQVQSPLDGASIAETISMTLDSWDEKADLAVVRWDQSPDPASLSAYMKAAMPVLAQKMGVPADVAAAPDFKPAFTIKMNASCRYEMAISTGLAKKATCTVSRGISGGETSQLTTDTYVMSENLVP